MRDALLQCRDAWQWPPAASPVAPERLHVTLHFLGAVPLPAVPDLCAGLAAVRARRFELRFGRPDLWHGGVAVLLPLAVPPALLELQRQLGEALQGLGMTPEARPYRPHVTLARKAQGAHLPTELIDVHWRVRGFALVESRPGRPPAYHVLQRYP